MADTPPEFQRALSQFNRSSLAPWLAAADEERQSVLTRFPRDAWPTLPLERYALGLDDPEPTYCDLLEFRTQHLGSMKGGSARKLLIYKRRDQDAWWFERAYTSEREAWDAIRRGFVRLLQLGAAGDWAALADRGPLQNAPALTTKTLHVYFPDEILPIASRAHLLHFLGLLGREGPTLKTWDVVGLNRMLLAAVREQLSVADWRTNEIERFLYAWADPRTQARIVKIAPGEEGRYWEECLASGYICVGWDKLGDLQQYASRDAFRARFEELYGAKQKGNAKHKASELWTLMELEPGDRVVANRGISQVLGVGEVIEPGYVWRPDRAEYQHSVTVKWDPASARQIPPQKRWAFQTVADIPAAQWAAITKETPGIAMPTSATAPARIEDGSRPTAAPDPVLTRLAAALDRRNQVILYGPPGTGKTYTARRFSVWWLLRAAGAADADAVLASHDRFAQAERNLVEDAGVGALTRITFHPSYSYEDFVEGFRPHEGKDGTLALRLEPGIFKRICSLALKQPDRKFLVHIDEINRANVAKVFGELITLIESDKRDLAVVLPQSKERFRIPENVYLVGTMNTADRSIRLLDAALRRRFAFVEVPPNPTLLAGGRAGDLPLDQFLEALNRRIAEHVGLERQIGHSFFLQDEEPIEDAAEFGRRFREEVLPLLQEYCYDDPAQLGRLLGAKLVDPATGALAEDVLADDEGLAEELAEELLDKEASAAS